MSVAIEDGDLEAEDFELPCDHRGKDLWHFEVKSYQLNHVNFGKKQDHSYGLGILLTDNEQGSTAANKKHAILQFYREGCEVPPAGIPNKEKLLLHLNYSIAEFAGIMDLLKSGAELRCYHKGSQNHSGILQIQPVGRQ